MLEDVVISFQRKYWTINSEKEGRRLVDKISLKQRSPLWVRFGFFDPKREASVVTECTMKRNRNCGCGNSIFNDMQPIHHPNNSTL